MEESWEEVRCADSALRKEAYVGVSFCNTAIYSVENDSCGGSFYGFAVQQREGS